MWSVNASFLEPRCLSEMKGDQATLGEFDASEATNPSLKTGRCGAFHKQVEGISTPSTGDGLKLRSQKNIYN